MVYWVDDPNGAATPPEPPADTGLENWFQEEDAANGIPKVYLRAWLLNMLIEEPLTVVTKAGIKPSKADNTQLYQALCRLFAGVGVALKPIPFSRSGNYTPSAAAKSIRVRMCAGGGPGGGATANPSGGASAGSAGGAAGYIEFWYPVSAIKAPVQITIGVAGEATGTGMGVGGGDTTIVLAPGVQAVAKGGAPGPSGTSVATGSAFQVGQAAGGGVDTSALTGGMLITANPGQNGPNGLVLANGSSVGIPVPGIGPQTPFGAGGSNTNTGSGGQALGYGSGGGGAGSNNANGGTGGPGGPGYLVIEEFG